MNRPITHPAGALPAPPPTILVVDDEPSVCALLHRALSQAGYAVAVAADGLEALDCLKHTPIALLISDLIMPQMDGIALCMRVRAEPTWAALPIVVISAATDFAAFPSALATTVLRKPLALAALLTCVERLIGPA